MRLGRFLLMETQRIREHEDLRETRGTERVRTREKPGRDNTIYHLQGPIRESIVFHKQVI